MAYTNSSMVAYTKFSPNHSGQRTHSIDRINPHCVVGQCTAEGLGDWFAKSSTQATSGRSPSSEHPTPRNRMHSETSYALSDRYDRTKERLDKVSGRIMERQAKREMIEAFLHVLAEMDEDVQEFTDDLWFNLLDHVTVFSKKDVKFTFKNGTEISVK